MSNEELGAETAVTIPGSGGYEGLSVRAEVAHGSETRESSFLRMNKTYGDKLPPRAEAERLTVDELGYFFTMKFHPPKLLRKGDSVPTTSFENWYNGHPKLIKLNGVSPRVADKELVKEVLLDMLYSN